MASGSVKWFNGEKGYGFIAPDDGGSDLFIHFSNIRGDGYKTLQEGEPVDFEASEGQKGPEAINVQSRGGNTATRPPYGQSSDSGRRW